MEVTNSGLFAEIEDVLRPFDVRAIRLTVFAGGDEAQARSIVQHAVAVLIDPMSSRRIQAEERLSDVTFEHVRPRHFALQQILPRSHQGFDAVLGGLSPAAANHGCDWHIGQHQISQEVTPQQSGRSGQ